MSALIPSIFAGLIATATAAIAQWYVWGFRYRSAAPPTGRSARLRGGEAIHVPSVSGREMVITLTRVQRA